MAVDVRETVKCDKATLVATPEVDDVECFTGIKEELEDNDCRMWSDSISH